MYITNFMGETKEFSARTIDTRKVYPKAYRTQKEAEQCISQRAEPSKWEVVERTVIYGAWESV